MSDLTPDQARIRKAAHALWDALAYVPDSTVDYRVENARSAALVMMNSAEEIVTEDVKDAKEDA